MKQSNVIGALSAYLLFLNLFSSSVHAAALVSGQGTWETTLMPRDLDGDTNTSEAYYDVVLDITWLADTNYALSSGYDATGRMKWTPANTWAAGLDPYASGITGWRLPTVTDTGAPGCDYAYSGTDCGYNVDTTTGEMASMFYDTLGNLGYLDTSGSGPQPDYGVSNTGPFFNLKSSFYWSGSDVPSAFIDFAWYFDFDRGAQNDASQAALYYAWAVHDGDVGVPAVWPTPIPATVWLFGSGLLGLIGISRRKKAA